MAPLPQPPIGLVEKGFCSAFALIGIIMLAATYFFLIEHATLLSNVSRLPLDAIRSDVQKLLNIAWKARVTKDCVQLRYMGYQNEQGKRIPQLPDECTALLVPRGGGVSTWLTSGSLLTRSLVQIGVWEWVFFGIMIAMLLAVMTYNGFFSGTPQQGAVQRLFITVSYCLAYVRHAYFIHGELSQLFGLIVSGSAWSMLHRANFSVYIPGDNGGPDHYYYIDKASTTFEEKTFDDNIAPTDKSTTAGKADGSGTDKPPESKDEEDDADQSMKKLKEALDTIKKSREEERKTCQDAAKDALDKTIGNGLIMVGVLVSCGFTGWTSVPSSALTTQVGSWGLLASLGVGVGMMFAGALSLHTARQAFNQILILKELIIHRSALQHVTKMDNTRNLDASFTLDGGIGSTNVWLFLFDHSTWSRFLLGPLARFVPSSDDKLTGQAHAAFNFTVSLGDENLKNLVDAETPKSASIQLIITTKPPAGFRDSRLRGEAIAVGTLDNL